jgi:RNA polymerase sigma-70 factor (ECF subfamily)
MTSDASADDLRLVAQVARGDERALDALYERYRPRLRVYLWPRLGGDPGLVEEALQDTFLAVWENAARFRGEAKVATWVFQIAHNVATQAHRRGARRPQQAPLLAAEPQTASVRDPYAEGVITRLAVHDALGKLSEKHREIVDLFFRQGFVAEEIALILDIPAGTVRSRLSYARKALRQELEDSQARMQALRPRSGREG